LHARSLGDTNERSLEEFLKVTSWLPAILKEKKEKEEKGKEERKKSKQALIANYVRSRKIR